MGMSSQELTAISARQTELAFANVTRSLEETRQDSRRVYGLPVWKTGTDINHKP